MSEQPGTVTVEGFAKLFGVGEAEIRRLSKKGFLPAIEKNRLPTAPAINAMATVLRADYVTTEEAGQRLGVTGQWIRKLQNDGFIPKAAAGFLPYREAAVGYIKWLKDQDRRASRTAGETRVKDARASEIELRIAERRRELISIDDAEAAIDDLASLFRLGIDALPARVTRDLGLRAQIQRECDDLLNRVADRAAQAGRALVAGEPVAPPVPEDAA